jgi:hypothetical protein
MAPGPNCRANLRHGGCSVGGRGRTRRAWRRSAVSTASQSRLLVRRGFAAFFVTQLLSAFNDNFFKNAVMIWISATKARAFGLTPEVMISLCTGVFILPFFLFSATAGQLADRYGKSGLIKLI